MMFDVAEEARKEMLLLGFKKPIHSKPKDLGLWKKGQVHESRGITYTIYNKTIPAEHMCSFQHQVYRASKNVCAQQLNGFNLDDS